MVGDQIGKPTPWWQLPGQSDAKQNLEKSAPPGYTYDSVQMKYVPMTKSAPYQNERTIKADTHADNSMNLRDSILAGLRNYTGGSSSMSSMSGGGGEVAPYQPQTYSNPQVQYQSPSGPDVGAIAGQAEDAAMSKAKATAGALGRSSLESLRSGLAERGILGSGTEARGTVDRLAAATNPLSDINAASLKEQVGIAEHNKDLGFQEANTRYQGEIAQRGQDIGGVEAANSANLTARGQDISAANARNQMILQQNSQRLQALSAALAGLKGSY
jgi:hypothetical protein